MNHNTIKSDLLKELHIERPHHEKQVGRARGYWVASFLIALILVLAVWYYLRSEKSPEIEVATAVALSQGSVDTAVLQATGYVTARRSATVSAQITGTLIDVLIEEGDKVSEKQVLAHLESTAQQAALTQAQAGVRAAQALLAQYKTQFEQNLRDLKRQQDIVARKLASQQSLELAQTQVDSQAALVASQAGQIEVARANAQAAQVQLDYCTLRAPFAGVVIDKAAQPGEIVSPVSAGGGFTRTGVATIVDMDSLEVDVDVNEAYINRVQPHQQAQIVLDAYPDWKIPAHVIAVIPTADKAKATVKVRVAIETKDGRILPDMGVHVSFFEEQKTTHAASSTGVLVPASAIVQRDGKNQVFEIDGDHVRTKSVTPGQNYDDLRLVEGLAIGTHLVKQPPTELADGMRIRIKAAAK